MNTLILGIDPGATLGYAILDIEGRLIKLDSAKNMSLNQAVMEVNKMGKIAVIGTDVSPAPKFIEKVARNFGAEIIEPDDDLLLKYKKRLTKEFLKDKDVKARNKHELDALASALAALKHFKPLFNKIDNHLNQAGKTYLSREIKKDIITKKISIKKALEKYA